MTPEHAHNNLETQIALVTSSLCVFVQYAASLCPAIYTTIHSVVVASTYNTHDQKVTAKVCAKQSTLKSQYCNR